MKLIHKSCLTLLTLLFLGSANANVTEEDFVARTKEITNGRGVDVVYDSVGQATFMKSLDCLRPIGMMVSFGQSSGSVPAFDPDD